MKLRCLTLWTNCVSFDVLAWEKVDSLSHLVLARLIKPMDIVCMRANRRTVWLRIVCFAFASVAFPWSGWAQEQPFSSTAEYRSMLDELQHPSIHPSEIGAGTLLTSGSATAIPVRVKETAAALHLETDAWRLDLSKDRWGVALMNKETGLTWRLTDSGDSPGSIIWTRGDDQTAGLRPTGIRHIERRGNSWLLEVSVQGLNEPLAAELTLISPTVIRFSVRAPQLGNKAGTTLNFRGAGPFFGLGERFDKVKLDGLKTTLRPEDLYGKPGHNWTYIPVPFLFTSSGLGMYLDTEAVSNFDLSQAGQQRFSVQLDRASVDSYFFVGSPKSIVEDYTALTGRTPLPPPWAFGVWICSYQGPQQVLQEAERLRKEKIPSSAMWTFDVMGKGDIMGWPLWWTGYYPDPRKFTDQLHSMGFKALTYVHPYLRSVLNPYNLPNPSFEEGTRNGLFVLNAAGKPTGPIFEPYVDGNIDFTSAKNVDWWEKRLRTILVDNDFDGWMEDFGEAVDKTDRFAAGVTGREMENLNPLFYHKITYEISRKFKPDVVEFDRSGYAGSQGYTRVIWGGDQLPDWTQDHGLPSVVRGGITTGLLGFGVWGPDIAGNGYSKELWTRWVEFGALTPIMRNHSWDKPYGAVDLWYDKETTDTFRRYAGLHVSLFPYLYSYAQEAAKDGLPIIRHPMLEFPKDQKAYDTEAEYMLGEKMLIAPVVEQGATSRSFYLPKGDWVNYWTGALLEGGQQVTVAAPLEQIPILLRSGSIVPLISAETQTLTEDLPGSHSALTRDLIWRVFPASGVAQDSFTLFDGTTAMAKQSQSEMSVSVEHSPLVRQYEIVLPMTNNPHCVAVGGKKLSELDGEGKQNPKTGWQLSSNDGTLHVYFLGDDFKLNVAR